MNNQTPMTTQTQAKAPPLPLAVKEDLTRRAEVLAAQLPGNITAEQFIDIVTRAVADNPDIQACTKRSILSAAMKAATDGLVLDGREAAFVRYNKKNRDTGKWEHHCQYMPMVYGLIKKVRQSGEVNSLRAHVVFERDDFLYELGDDESLSHRPSLSGRGDPIGAYAIAKLSNGEILREFIDVDGINKVRAVSKAKDSGPWVDWWEEMARKTVIRRLSKYLPMSAEAKGVIRHDDEVYDLGGGKPIQPVSAADVLSHQPEPAAGAIEHQASPVEDVIPDEPRFTFIDRFGEEIGHNLSGDQFTHLILEDIARCPVPEAIDKMLSANTFDDLPRGQKAAITKAANNQKIALDEAAAGSEDEGDEAETATAAAGPDEASAEQAGDDDTGHAYEDGDPGPGADETADDDGEQNKLYVASVRDGSGVDSRKTFAALSSRWREMVTDAGTHGAFLAINRETIGSMSVNYQNMFKRDIGGVAASNGWGE